MKHLLRNLLILFYLLSYFSISYAAQSALVPQTGQNLCYNTSGVVIPCVGTGQDGDIKAGVAWPNPRFTDNANGTVTDNLTGLMWTKNANLSKSTWPDALNYASSLNTNSYLGFSDWRIPSIRELESLVDITQAVPAISIGHPFINIVANNYWSNSSVQNQNNTAAYVVNMNGGAVGPAYKTYSYYVWLVRTDKIDTLAPPSKTGQTISYANNDDGALQSGVSWPVPRFNDNLDGTVTDNLTNIMWLKNANCFGSQTWDNAFNSVNTLSSENCGLADNSEAGNWRLPNKNELWSLFDFGRSLPGLPNGHPFYNVQAYYWSSSSAFSPRYAWSVSLDYGYLVNIDKYRSDSYYVLPVRSVQNWTLGSLILYANTSDFENIEVGTFGMPKQIRLKNKGTTPLSILSTNLTGTDPAQFVITPSGSNACSSLTPILAAGTNCTLAVTFVPTTSGAKTAKLTITTDSGSLDIPLKASAYTTIFGDITDMATGQPVPSAMVSLDTGISTTTDINGSYNFGTLTPPGSYNIVITKAGYQTTSRGGITVTTTSSAKSDIYLPVAGILNITNTFLPWATPGVQYNERIFVAGGTAPYTFSIPYGALPSGLQLNTSTGVITGTPTGSGSYTFTVRVVDSASTVAEREFTIDLVSPLTILSTSIPDGNQGNSYSASITVSGGKSPYTYSLEGTLPKWLSFSAGGILSGYLKESGSFSFNITVTDSTGIKTTKTFNMNVATAPSLTFVGSLPNGSTGVAYSQNVVSGGVPPYTSTLTGILPPGLSLASSTGVISGTPSAGGLANFSILIKDNALPTPNTVSKVFSITISSLINGVCGSSNGGMFATIPTANLCGDGTTPSSVTNSSNLWNWSCFGANGGSNASCSANMDTTPPTGTVKINSGAYATNKPELALTLTASDNLGDSGVGYYSASVTPVWPSIISWSAYPPATLPKITLDDMTNGTKTVYVKFKDKGDNVSGVYTDTINFDTIPPEILNTSYYGCGTYNTTGRTINVSGQATDKYGLNIIGLTGGGTGSLLPAGKYSAIGQLLPGLNTLYLLVYDNAGNKKSKPIYLNRDGSLPWFTISLPSDNGITDNPNMTITGSTANDSDTVQVRLNCGSIIYAAKNGKAFSASVVLSAGVNNIQITVLDSQTGKENTMNRAITYDSTQNMSLTISSPAQDMQTAYASVTLNGKVTATTTPTVTINVDKSTYTPTITGTAPNFNFTQRIEFASQKTYAIKVSALDQNNHKIYSVRHVVYKKGVLINNDADSTSSRTVTLTLNPPDYFGIPVTQYQYSFDNITWQPLENLTATTSVTLPEGAGSKSVFVKYKYANGVMSGVIGDYINLQ